MGWYLVKTKVRDEEKAAFNLKDQEFTVYLPLINVESIKRGERSEDNEPAFPGYVFINFDPEQQSAMTVNSTRGVIKIVSFGGALAFIPDKIITHIKATLDKKRVNLAPIKGQPVRINTGPFKDLDAIFEQPEGPNRSRLFISLMSKKQSIIISNTDFQ